MTKWKSIDVDGIDFFKGLRTLKLRDDLMARVVHWQLAKRRQGTHETKEEGDVRGSTRKLFKQKGTGNARQGGRRAPHMRGGAVIFGPHNRSYDYALPKKVKALGLLHALASRTQSDALKIFKDLTLDSFKTKDVAKLVKDQFGGKKVLFVDDNNENLTSGVRNLYGVDVIPVIGLNVYDILKHDIVVCSEAAVHGIKERVARVC